MGPSPPEMLGRDEACHRGQGRQVVEPQLMIMGLGWAYQGLV